MPMPFEDKNREDKPKCFDNQKNAMNLKSLNRTHWSKNSQKIQNAKELAATPKPKELAEIQSLQDLRGIQNPKDPGVSQKQK